MGQWTVKREAGVAVVSMDDGKVNALTLAEFDSLSQTLTEVERSDASAVVITGCPGFFSAGLNLKVVPNLPPPELQQLIRRFGEVMLQLYLFPKPVVAAINGHAIAGGAMIALGADVRLFASGAFKFGLNEVPGGLFVPTFGIELVRGAAPVEHLLELVLHGRMVNPDEAKALRLVEAVLTPDALFAAAMQRATALGELGGDAYARTKRHLRGPSAERAYAALAGEVESLGQALTTRR